MILRRLNRNKNISYSQYGEDNIISLMQDLYNIRNINYIDIGAHHPFNLNNTQLLYEKGMTGINIEPDPIQFKLFKKERAKDINLNIGLHYEQGSMTFYQFNRPEFNTFSKDAADEIERKGIKKINEILVKVDTYNNIVEKYCQKSYPNLISLDAEGLDETIIKSINFTKYAPKIICVETYAYGVGEKNKNLINYILGKGYEIHADTFVNTIFIRVDRN